MASTEKTPMVVIPFVLIIVTSIMLSYALFGDIQTSEEFNQELEYDTPDNQQIGGTYNTTGEITTGSEEGQGFVDLLYGAGNFITFGDIDNIYARLLLNTFMTILYFIIGYTIMILVRQWIPSLIS